MADKEATGTLSITGGTGIGPSSGQQLGAGIAGEAAFDYSGGSVSLSADGSTVAIGATGNDGGGIDSGHVRIYQRNSSGDWEQVGADINGEAAGDYSGKSVSLSADGSTIAIGAYGNDGNGDFAGHVRIYELNSNGNWVQVGADIDGEAVYDQSGTSVSLSADGSTVAIGATANDGNGAGSGHVRIYQRNSATNVWEQLGADIDGEAVGDHSGESVSLSADGSTVAIGATRNNGWGIDSGHVRIYQHNVASNVWEQVGADIDGERYNDYSGGSVSLSANGSTVAIGAYGNDSNGNDDAGHVRIYQHNVASNVWEQVGADINGEAAGDYSGESVSLSADGSTVAIGAPYNGGNGTDSGHVRIYQRNSNGDWEQVGADIDGEASRDYSGYSVSLSADGSTVAIGATGNEGNGGESGHVRIYELRARQGDILSANLADVVDADGAIQSTSYQWQSSSDNGVTWSDLSETNQRLDTSTPSLVGQDVRVTATTTDALGGSTSFTSAAINITADTDVPIFTSGGTAAAIDENSGAGQVIYTATATDNTSVSYSLKANNNDDAFSFSIDASTGEVSLNTDPDHRTQSSYSFTVIATDVAGNTSEQSVMLDLDVLATGTLTITGATGTGPSSWQQLGTDIDGEAAFDYSGDSVSLSADGSTVAIGAPYSDGNGGNSGHVRIYQRNALTNAWEQVGADIDGEAAVDTFGWSVSLSADGSTVAIGAPYSDGNGDGSGRVRIYQHNSATNAWDQVGADIDGEAEEDRSGWSISLSADGSTVAIGAFENDGNGSKSGHVRIYQHNVASNVWEQVGADIDGEAAGDHSGASVSLSADGSTVAIGAYGNNDGNVGESGHVRIYQRNSSGSWQQVGADIDGEAAGDQSGWSVSLSADGSTVAVGAFLNDDNDTNAGHVRIYQRNSNGDWEQVGADIDGEAANDLSGYSVSLSAEGSTVAIGASQNGGNGERSGHVRIYQRNTATNVWEQVGADIDGEAAGDYSGDSVSLSADGSTVAIGAPYSDGIWSTNAGHVRIYQINTPTQAQQGDILSANLADVLDADGAIQSTTYQWQSSSDNGANWTDLSGETNQQLNTSSQFLVGQDVRVIATTTDALGGSTSFTSAALHITADTDAPIFTSGGTAAAIDEDSGAGQVIYTATATDNTSVVYSLKANNNDDAASFSIDALTGEVSLEIDPDYETQSAYAFNVIATDVVGNSSEQSIALAVNDIAEPPRIKSIHAVKAKRKAASFSLNKPLKIEGQELDAVIIGTKKRDRITGTSKNEILAGFKGKDVLKGGGGADGFLFDKPIGFGKKQMDKILDFDPEDLDKILVDKKAFGLGRKIKFRAVNRKSQLKKASRAKVDFVYENKTGFLYFNENGKKSGFGDGGLFAQLQGKPELFADDFRIV